MPISANLQVDTLNKIADRINEFSDSMLHAIEVNAVNRTADRAYQMAKVEMNRGINLSTQYIESKMQVRYAKRSDDPTAVVGTRMQYIFASRFDYKQLVKPVKNPARSKGDPKRGIPKGFKQAGLSVEVTRGARKEAPQWFVVPLKQYGADWSRPGSFFRIGDGKNAIDPRYGPSAHQLFSHVIGKDQAKYEQVLQEEFLSAVDKVFKL